MNSTSRNFLFSVNLIPILLRICGRTAYDHSAVVPTHSVACAVGAADQSSVGNCWAGREGTCAFRPTSDLRLSSTELGSQSSPFTLKFLLGHSLFSSGLLFLLNLFRISVEVEIRQDLPWVFTGDGATHMQNFPGQHPAHQAHCVSPLVVARDGDVHIARGECATQSSGRQVNIRHLGERLVVSPGISNHRKSWLLEGCLDLVSEGSRSEAAGNRSGSGGSSELQHCSLASIPGPHDRQGFQWQQWHELPAEASPRFSSDL